MERGRDELAPFAKRIPTGSRYVPPMTGLPNPCPRQADRDPLGERQESTWGRCWGDCWGELWRRAGHEGRGTAGERHWRRQGIP